ncbi:hypothetical protein [Hymenobacter volaticus]|uniref:Lipid/polyisoprenoid-binding YceI-like domain-containing protein n=1 Tax=Hymenobacter volaticus TaxID=2932254 RepID=A0ABY4G6A1_9BACT|nr:hypothetical protein [Hymenobacter volaticus]UOQ66396.1 hypothetical protein MUN86_00225 [Hymenobacter volaticus]
MKIFTRMLFLAALTTASAVFTGCSDKAEAPTPADPDPAFRMGSYFDFTTITPAGGTAHSGFGTTHSALDIKGSAAISTQVLALDFTAGADDAHFEVDRARLSADWLGTYALRCRKRPTDPVFTSYVHSANGVSSIYRFSDFALDLTGDVTITTYDAKRQLVSGHYEVRAPEQLDPTNTGISNAPKCTILLAGDFENLKVKTQ